MVAVSDDVVFAVPQRRPCQFCPLDVCAKPGHVVDGVAVIDPHEVRFR